MKINLKHVFDNDAPKMRLPRYARRARGYTHLASVCTVPADGIRSCEGFDLGVCFFRNGEVAAVLWGREYRLEDIKEIHRKDRFAKFALTHISGNAPSFARIITVARAKDLANYYTFKD